MIFHGQLSIVHTKLIHFGVFFLNLYRNILTNDIKYTTSRNSEAFLKVCPLSRIAFEKRIVCSSFGCDSAHLCVNPNYSILDVFLGLPLSIDELVATGEGMTYREFDSTIGVITLQFTKTNNLVSKRIT